jgi:hypothetical protein
VEQLVVRLELEDANEDGKVEPAPPYNLPEGESDRKTALSRDALLEDVAILFYFSLKRDFEYLVWQT